MALTPATGTMPGFRTVDGGDISKVMDAINGVTAGNVVSGGVVSA